MNTKTLRFGVAEGLGGMRAGSGPAAGTDYANHHDRRARRADTWRLIGVAYAPTDHGPSQDGKVDAGHVSVSGGCGVPFGHEVLVTDQGRPYIDCEICGPKLVGGHYGWAASPAAVPLTPDEVAERDLAERDGVAMQRIVLRSVTDSLVTQAGAQKGLLGQIKSLSAADRAELLAVLQGNEETGSAKTVARTPQRKA